MPDTARFVLNIRKAVSHKRFQFKSDGWEAYEWAIEAGLSDRADDVRIVKALGPGRVEAVLGRPDLSQTETTYLERLNGDAARMVPALRPQDTHLLEEAREAPSGAGPRLRALQLLPDSPHAARDPGDGGRDCPDAVDQRGAAGGSVPVGGRRLRYRDSVALATHSPLSPDSGLAGRSSARRCNCGGWLAGIKGMLAGGFQPSGIGLYPRSSTRPRSAVLSSRLRFLNISGTSLQELYRVDPVPDINQDTVALDAVPIAGVVDPRRGAQVQQALLGIV